MLVRGTLTGNESPRLATPTNGCYTRVVRTNTGYSSHNNCKKKLTQVLFIWKFESAVIFDRSNPMYGLNKHIMMTSSNGNISALLAICAGNSPVPGEFPAQRPVTRSFDVYLICVWINGWVNNREAGDLRPYRAHYDVTVMYEVQTRLPAYSGLLYGGVLVQSCRSSLDFSFIGVQVSAHAIYLRHQVTGVETRNKRYEYEYQPWKNHILYNFYCAISIMVCPFHSIWKSCISDTGPSSVDI